MFNILLSDRALKDFSDAPEAAAACLKSLSTQVNKSSDGKTFPRHPELTRLKWFTPATWRYRYYFRLVWYRVVFTLAQDKYLIIQRILRKKDLEDYQKELPKYLYEGYIGNEIPFKNGILDLDAKDNLDETIDTEFDCQYGRYSRHYRLPKTIVEDSSRSEEDLIKDIAQYILTGSYLYRPKLTNEQENLSYELSNEVSKIIRIQGAAGTGKTTLAFHLAHQAIAQGHYPLILVPNAELQRFGKAIIDGLDQNYQISLQVQSQEENHLSILTFEHFFQSLSTYPSDPLSPSDANAQIRQFLQECAIPLRSSLENLDLYTIQQAILEPHNTYLSNKDALLNDQKAAVELLKKLERNPKFRQRYSLFSQFYNQRDFVSQATQILQEIEASKSSLNQHLGVDKPVTLIIDEVQDCYWLFIKIAYCLWKHQTRSGSFVLLGDVNQRVVISGFTWNALFNSFQSTYGVELERYRLLAQNFRNTQAITKVAEFFLQKAFRSAFAGGRHPEPLPEAENCFEVGLPPRLIECDEQWISQFIQRFRQETESLEQNQSRFIFIVHEFSHYYQHLQQEFGADSDQAVVLNVRQAKGQEFDAVVLVSPFILRKETVSPDDIFEWYTAITRARRYEAILISSAEMSWLRENIHGEEQLESLFAISSNWSFQEFIHELLLEGRSFLSVQQFQQIFVSRLMEAIQRWLQTGQEPPQVAVRCQRQNFQWWEICDIIASQSRKPTLEEWQPIEFLRHIDDPLLESRPLDLVVLYFGARYFLSPNQFNGRAIASRLIEKLEIWFYENPQMFPVDLNQITNYELKAILLRSKGYSWQAAELYAGNFTREWIEDVASDLTRRGLPYEAARLKLRYLNQQPPSDYPEVEVLYKSGFLVENLCNHFVQKLENL